MHHELRRRATSSGALGGRFGQQRASAPASLWLRQDRQPTGAAQQAEAEAAAATVAAVGLAAGRGSGLPLSEDTKTSKEARISE